MNPKSIKCTRDGKLQLTSRIWESLDFLPDRWSHSSSSDLRPWAFPADCEWPSAPPTPTFQCGASCVAHHSPEPQKFRPSFFRLLRIQKYNRVFVVTDGNPRRTIILGDGTMPRNIAINFISVFTAIVILRYKKCQVLSEDWCGIGRITKKIPPSSGLL